jgi:hypothetical protein
MDNLDKLINDLSAILTKKYFEQYYLITSNLSVKVANSEVLQNWSCFLNKNNIDLIPIDCAADRVEYWQDSTYVRILLDLINREQHKIKNKLIFPMECWLPSGCLAGVVYVLTTRENAQKLVVLGSFEN